ncbi:unnamed protein product [Coffea canephora]|uniref:Transmembrane protein n=1 Tax=Coffea canephora TaxID=49390 RepID=A0A068U959_COFCA|nr:unnamed protein product [Coffea canephora]
MAYKLNSNLKFKSCIFYIHSKLLIPEARTALLCALLCCCLLAFGGTYSLLVASGGFQSFSPLLLSSGFKDKRFGSWASGFLTHGRLSRGSHVLKLKRRIGLLSSFSRLFSFSGKSPVSSLSGFSVSSPPLCSFFMPDNHRNFFLIFTVDFFLLSVICTCRHETHKFFHRLGVHFCPRIQGFFAQKMVTRLIH